jgi:hypothetical protein
VVNKLMAAFSIVAVTLSTPAFAPVPAARADGYCELGNLLIPQEVHHVGTYRTATCAMVADLVITSGEGCRKAVADYIVSRGYDPYVGKDIALHNC